MVKEEIQKLVSEGNTKDAIHLLVKHLRRAKIEKLIQEAVIISSRYYRLSRERRIGTLTQEQESIAINQIHDALLSLVDQAQEKLHLSARTPGKTPGSKFKRLLSWNTVIAVGVLVGIAGGIAEFTGLNILELFEHGTKTSNSVTILVHGPKGKDEKVLPNRGIVKLIYGDAIVSKQINNNCEAIFTQIDEAFFRSNAYVEILFEDPEGEPYLVVNSDSLYELSQGRYLALEVKLFGLEKVRGIVKDFNTGYPIEGVRVSLQGESAYSNEFGEYLLKIPLEKQQKLQTIRAFKVGYEPFEIANIPIQTQQELPVLLKSIK